MSFTKKNMAYLLYFSGFSTARGVTNGKNLLALNNAKAIRNGLMSALYTGKLLNSEAWKIPEQSI